MINTQNGGPSITGTGPKCKICGHESHCGTSLHKEFLDGERKPITVKVCYSCQCEKCKDKKNGIQTK